MLPEAIWSQLDVVTPNETEAEVLTGIHTEDHDSAVRAGQSFTDRGVGAAIITKAERRIVGVRADGTTSSAAPAPACRRPNRSTPSWRPSTADGSLPIAGWLERSGCRRR